MIKMILKSTLIFSLFTNLNAQTGMDREFVASQCHNLSETVNSLVLEQHNVQCIEKLNQASMQMNLAGKMVLANMNEDAKHLLTSAVLDLQYAQLNSCSRYIEISHSKLEAHKLKQLL